MQIENEQLKAMVDIMKVEMEQVLEQVKNKPDSKESLQKLQTLQQKL